MHCRSIQVGPYAVNCAIIWSQPDAAWIIDPGDDASAIMAAIRAEGLTVSRYLFTHGHIDHISALDALCKLYPAPVHLHAADAAWAFGPVNRLPPDYPNAPARPADLRTDLADGVEINDPGLNARVIATPGHSPGCVCFRFQEAGLLISGDTLFAGSVGRTDLPGGNSRQLASSLRRLKTLPDTLRVLPGHGPSTTIERERRVNPFFGQTGGFP